MRGGRPCPDGVLPHDLSHNAAPVSTTLLNPQPQCSGSPYHQTWTLARAQNANGASLVDTVRLRAAERRGLRLSRSTGPRVPRPRAGGDGALGSDETQDPEISDDLVDKRGDFLFRCADSHWQFDELRRAHYSTMMIMAHLGGMPNNQDAQSQNPFAR